MNLAAQPPRRPRAELAGVLFLPRSIDKARASLPGGDLGPYKVVGFTERMLGQLGITPEAFIAAVAAAGSDDDIAAFVLANTTPEKIAKWNEIILMAKPRSGDRAAALEAYPWLIERPDLILSADVLEEDDKRYFAARG